MALKHTIAFVLCLIVSGIMGLPERAVNLQLLTTIRPDQGWKKAWRATIGQIAILLPLLIVVAVIQVLPQVDLPDTAFHEDTAPIITKSRAIAPLVLSICIFRDAVEIAVTSILANTSERFSTTPHYPRLSLSIFHSVILC